MESPQFEVTDETRLSSSLQDIQIDESLNKKRMGSTTCCQDMFQIKAILAASSGGQLTSVSIR